VNILFANYGDCTSNSLNHIGAYANQLTRLGHSCIVAVPDHPETQDGLVSPLFRVVTFAEIAAAPRDFPNRRGADVLHAWTPRENVRRFALKYLAQVPTARLVIHLEDNEAHLTDAFLQREGLSAAHLTDAELAHRLPANLSVPLRAKHFLSVAHGITHITEKLKEFAPPESKTSLLLPGLEKSPAISDDEIEAERRLLKLTPDEKLVVYTGSTTFANLPDVKCLTVAVRLLNESGAKVRLVRTGHQPAEYQKILAEVGGDFVTDLGFVAKTRLPRILAAADVLVQPGAADDFNTYRLPSKLPEFLWAGRPTVLPAANIGILMREGREGLLLNNASPEEIARRCREVLADPALAKTLGKGAHTFARMHFDLASNTNGLVDFYESLAEEESVFGDGVSVADETAVLVDRIDPDLGQRVRGLVARIEKLEADLSTAERIKRRHQSGERYNAAKIQEQRHVTEHVRTELKKLTQDLVPLVDRLEKEKADLQNLVAHNEQEHERRHRALESKLARVTQSGSWVFTAPLRALRRALIDPFLRREAAAETKVTPESNASLAEPNISIDPGLPHSIDEPADWAAVPARGRMRGWVVTQDRQEIVELRILAGELEVAVERGVPRPDVATLHPDYPYARNAGFTADYELPPGWEGETVFEALTADGKWRRFAARHTRVMSGSAESLRFHYREWVQRFDTLSLADTINHRARLEALEPEQRPLISVIMPVFNPAEPWLRQAIESVRDQYYPNWELCIADDASTEPHVAAVLESYAEKDTRIKVVTRPENGHISAASNSALALATGDYGALLDHDDSLAPHALAEVVYALSKNPELQFIYTDEDKIDEGGYRSDPYFKPDWNPDLLRGQNYTCHFSIFRLQRLRDIGGFRVGLEGSQDWDLTLRATRDLRENQVHHIPQVLYHWRAIPGSTALVIDQKNDYPFRAAKQALTDDLAARGVSAELLPVEGHHWRIKYALPSPTPRVSLIIPTHNGYELLRTCVDSIRSRTDYDNYEIIVVDHQSNDPTVLKYLTQLESEEVLVMRYAGEFNFSAINNFAARHATGAFLAFLNNDLEVIDAPWLQEMVAQAARPEIGAVGAMLYFPDDTVQHAGVILGIGGLNGTPSVAGHAFKDAARGSEGQRNRLRLVQNYSAVTAACMVVQREVFETVGGFDEKSLAVAFNDIDFCLKVRRAGFRNLWTPFAELYHHESASRGIEDSPDKLDRFASEIASMRERWGDTLDRDPAYNPNLTAEFEDFSLAVPPRI
jgi:O-antigen biosynthesis protein